MAGTSLVTKGVAWLLGLSAVIAIYAVATSEPAPKVTLSPEEQKRAEMLKELERVQFAGKSMCRQAAERSLQLKDPKSAEWLSVSRMPMEQKPDKTWAVQAQVTATNSFNARVLTAIDCTMRLAGSEWELVKVAVVK